LHAEADPVAKAARQDAAVILAKEKNFMAYKTLVNEHGSRAQTLECGVNNNRRAKCVASTTPAWLRYSGGGSFEKESSSWE
jgi:hypothetical protein